MRKLIPHIILFRQVQYLFPEFFYDTPYYNHIKHWGLYLLVIFVFIGYYRPQERTKSLKWLVSAAILLEAVRAFDYLFIIWELGVNIFNIVLIVGILGGSIYHIIKSGKWK